MSDQHTPEPWIQEYDDNGFYEIKSEQDSRRITFTQREGSTDEANARRIVACVNACKGISTEDLETLPTLQTALDEAALIEKQRDELLAALESVAVVAHCGGLDCMSESDALTTVRRITIPYFDTTLTGKQYQAAIAKAKGAA